MSGQKPHLHVVGVGGTLRSASISRYALKEALKAAERTGATTEFLSLRTLALPLYEPDRSFEEYGPRVRSYINAVRTADALLISTAAYHGTIAGVTKNALDFLELLASDEPAYLEEKAVGLIAVSGGDSACVQALSAMVHATHALRAMVVPQHVFIPRASEAINEADILEVPWLRRLRSLARAVVRCQRRITTDSREVHERSSQGFAR